MGSTTRWLLAGVVGGVLVLWGSHAVGADDSATVYKAKCAVCHGPDGSGNTTMGKKLGAKDLRSPEVQKKSDAELFSNIAEGMGKTMPAYRGKLSDQEIRGLVAYIRELAKKK